MRKFAPIVVLLWLMVPAAAMAAEGISWFSLKEGSEKAGAEKKPLIVDFFYGKGCPRCEIIQKNVYDDPTIAKKIMADFVPVRIDLTKQLTPEEEALGTKYEYKMDCLLLFMDHKGEVIEDPSGKRLCFVENIEPDWFVSYLDMIRNTYRKK